MLGGIVVVAVRMMARAMVNADVWFGSIVPMRFVGSCRRLSIGEIGCGRVLGF